MIDPKGLVRGVFVALAITFAMPLAGIGGATLGVGEALAQSRDPLISAVLFEGNSGFSDAELLAMVDASARGIASPGVIEADAESIRLAYESKGYTNVTVTPRVEPTEGGRVRVTFVINEGQRSGIAAINFTGNNSIDAGTLKGVIKTRETHILSWLFRDDTYDPNKINLDKELIRIYYANRGFPDAVVTSVVAEYDAGRNAYFINFTISEGDRYEFSDVAIETSIAGLDADALTSTIRTRAGSRYSLADLEKTQADMAFEATQQGFPFADVRPRINRDVANHTFKVTYLVDEGPRVYVERIDITGNVKTRDFVIRRELGFAEGDPFNRSMVTRAKTAIEALGYFKSVTIDLQPGSSPDKVQILVSVVEDSTGDYGATLGYASDQGVLGEVSLTERNFLGRGQYLRVALGASASGKSVDFSFTEPRFMGLRISAGIDLYHRITDETMSNFYGSTATGGQLRFGAPITRDLSASVFVGAETKSYTDRLTWDHDGNPSTPEVPHTASMSSFVTDGMVRNKAWIGYSLVYTTLDDAKKPTEGLYATLTQRYTGWDYNQISTEVKARYFFPIVEDAGIIGSVRAQAGIVNAITGSVSPLESFQYGPSLVRGFQARQLGPRLTTGEITGSTMYAGLSGEIEFPIPVLPETYGIRGAVWADAAWIDGVPAIGSSTLDPLSVDQPLKSSVGASVIWDSPFGPLRGDFGYVISKATKDQTQIFQLTIQNLL
ncbi:MAG TPA: outer membrane protein assembly factor BamA [Alphaproteobacteria bacterium]|nr:outer membrane protein assembly factor BamA [Alphaproteobacteria bacterium]